MLDSSMSLKKRVLMVLFIIMLVPSVGFAYVDPNTSSTILFRLLFPMFVAMGAIWIYLKKKLVELVSSLVRKLRTRPQ